MTGAQIDEFHKWLINRGRDPTTADVYVTHVTLAMEDADPIRGRLLNKSLSPNTRHLALAALRSWAKYTNDMALRETLDDIRLPPARRVTVKKPLSRVELKRFIEAFDDQEDAPLKAVVGLMLKRGLRVGDVLRIRREEITNALRTNVLSFVAKGNKTLEFGVTRAFKDCLVILADQPKYGRVKDLLSNSQGTEAQKLGAAKMNVRRYLKEIASDAGIDPTEVYPHRLRRTVATYFLEKVGGDLTKLKAWLQWESIATAASYADYHTREELDEAGEKLFDD